MSDHINLDSVIYPEDTDFMKDLVDVIKVGLGRSGDVSTKAAALVDDIRTLCATYCAMGEDWEVIPGLCGIAVSVAFLLPPDHPWQDTFVQAMQNLQQTDMDDEQEFDEYDEQESDEYDEQESDEYDGQESDEYDGQESDEYDGQESDGDDELLDEIRHLNWKHLPELGMFMRDFWFDPTWRDGWQPEDLSRWKNLNSFAARFKTETFKPWLNFPIWQLRDVLEEKLGKGPILDSRLWIATEWILFYGELIFKLMASEEECNEGCARSLQGGSLCFGIKPLSSARLTFWKKRLLEMLDDREALGLSDGLAERVAKSVEKIDEFQNSQSQ